MRGAPQMGFSRHILRIRSRTLREMTGRPGWPRRNFQVQNNRKPARCQAMTVCGLTIARAERQSRQRRERQILSFAKTPAGFKISKIRQPRVTCYLDEFGRRTQLLRTTGSLQQGAPAFRLGARHT
jgi:hypothetical protein